MKALFLRNVPDDVVSRLQRLARREGMSVGALAVRELTDASRRADNAALLDALPDLRVDAAHIIDDIETERANRRS